MGRLYIHSETEKEMKIKDLPSGFILLAGGLEHEKEAREFIKVNNLTSNDVRLVKRKIDDYEQILVVKK